MIRTIFALSMLLLVSCSSTIPGTADIQRYYVAAEEQAQRDIDQLTQRRSLGEISAEEYQRREEAIRNSIPQRASQMAWARHELKQSEMRGMGIPTPDGPGVPMAPPTTGSIQGSFYRAPGGESSSYSRGMGLGRGGNQYEALKNSFGVAE